MENKIIIKRTSKLKVGTACRLTTAKVTIKIKQQANSRLIEAHLPECNLTLTRKAN